MTNTDAIEVRHWGTTGPQVVVLHGGPGAPGSVAGLARLLAEDFRVLEPRQRGSGDVPLTVARHVADLAAVAPDSAVLVGWSWGAMLGLSYAARHPERVRALALVGCGTYDEASRAHYRRTMDERLGEEGLARVAEIKRRAAETSDVAERDRLLGEWGDLATRAQACDPLPHDDDTLEIDARALEETWEDVLHLQAEGVEPAAFCKVTVPVLMLHGDHDPHPGPSTRDLLGAEMPQLEYVELPECGHEPWYERRARAPFLEALRGWLQRVEPDLFT